MKKLFVSVIMAFVFQVAHCVAVAAPDTLLMASKAEIIDVYFTLNSAEVLVENVNGEGNRFFLKMENPRKEINVNADGITSSGVSDILVVTKPVNGSDAFIVEVSFVSSNGRQSRVSCPFNPGEGSSTIYYGDDEFIGLDKTYYKNNHLWRRDRR